MYHKQIDNYRLPLKQRYQPRRIDTKYKNQAFCICICFSVNLRCLTCQRNYTSLMNEDQIITYIKENNIQKIKFAFADTDGILRGKVIHHKKFIDGMRNGY